MGLFTNGLFGGGGFGGMGIGGSQMFGTSPGLSGVSNPGVISQDQLNTAWGGAPGSMDALQGQYGSEAMGTALGQYGTPEMNSFMATSGLGGNYAATPGATGPKEATQGMFTGSGESFNNAARTGLMGYIGVNNVQNAEQGLEYMGQQQANANDAYARQVEKEESHQNLNF